MSYQFPRPLATYAAPLITMIDHAIDALQYWMHWARKEQERMRGIAFVDDRVAMRELRRYNFKRVVL